MGLTENDNCKKLGFLYAVLQSAKPYKGAAAIHTQRHEQHRKIQVDFLSSRVNEGYNVGSDAYILCTLFANILKTRTLMITVYQKFRKKRHSRR